MNETRLDGDPVNCPVKGRVLVLGDVILCNLTPIEDMLG